jgi:hypothetical protein
LDQVEIFDMFGDETRIRIPGTVTSAADLVKVGPKGYVHGWIKAGERVPGRDLTEWVRDNATKLRRAQRDNDPNEYGDLALRVIAEEQGWDAPATTGTAADLDQAITAGGVELWRGVQGDEPEYWGWTWEGGPEIGSLANPGWETRSPAARLEQLRTGQLRYGSGLYGNGVYASASHQVAVHYGNRVQLPDGSYSGRDQATPESIQRMVLRPEARIIDLDELEKTRATIPWPTRLTKDYGRLAAMLGYDAISVRGRSDADPPTYADQYILLNRTAALFEVTP